MRVLTIGSAMIDTIAVIASERIERMSMMNAETSFLLLEQGRKVEALDVSTHTGGGAVNSAVAYARLGHQVEALVRLGLDDRAQMLLERLTGQGVGSRWVVRDSNSPTGASVLISSHERDAAIFTHRGANGLLKVNEIAGGAFDVDIVHIASLSNASVDCFPFILENAKARGAFVLANPGIRQLSSRGQSVTRGLGSIDLLVLNHVEAAALVPLLSAAGSGRDHDVTPNVTLERPPRLLARGLSSGGFEMTLVRFMTALFEYGAKYVVLTDGTEGSYLGCAETIWYCPVLRVASVGSAGAGDAFAATTASYLAGGNSPSLALQSASINSASVVGFVDTQSGLLEKSDIERRVAEHSAKLPVVELALG